MEIKLNIPFQQLLELVEHLSKSEKDLLKKKLEKNSGLNKNGNDLKSFLLSGPVFTEDQMEIIEETRNAINQWRTK